jgi:hypothetical protein
MKPCDSPSEPHVEKLAISELVSLVQPQALALEKQSSVRLEKVAGEPFVLFHRTGAPSVFDEITALCRRAGFSPQVTMEPSLLTTVITWSKAGSECLWCLDVLAACRKRVLHFDRSPSVARLRR